MRKNLIAIGNSLGLVIERPILELLRISRDTELEISTDGDRLIIQPIRNEAETSASGSNRPRTGYEGVTRKKATR